MTEQNKDILNAQHTNTNVYYGDIDKQYKVDAGRIVEVVEEKKTRTKKED